MRNLVVSLIILLCGFLSYAGSVIETSVEFQHNPVGITLSSPRFSWKNTSSVADLQQAYYRIEVAQSESDLKKNKRLVWDSEKISSAMNSRNHIMLLGDVLIWMYEDLAGIKNHPDSIGFKKILMAPVFPDGLDFVKASHITPYGLVSSHWQRNGDSLEWEITIPANTSAELMVPASYQLKLGDNNSKAVNINLDNDMWKATVSSGTYKFKTF